MAVETVVQARSQVRQALQRLGSQEGGLGAIRHALQVVLGPGGKLGGDGAERQASVAVPAAALGQLAAHALRGVYQGTEEPLSALELHQGFAQTTQLALRRPMLEEVAQIRLGLPPDLG